MKHLLLVPIITTCLITASQAETVRVGFGAEPYPPFATPDAAGELHGWEVDITRAVCAAAELDCEIIMTSWDGLIPSLTTGKIDFIAASLTITPQRLRAIDFSDKYYQTSAAILGPQGDDLSATPEGVAGRTIGVQSASIHQAYANHHFQEARIREYQTQDEANQDLFSGRLDGILADQLILADYLTTHQGQICCELKGSVEHDEAILGGGVGFGVRKGDNALRETLNAAIADIREDGTYDEISARYFDFDIYGD
ncbi:transporter substrate-binding domain-containing protein [Vreelandella zhaodongensis]|uniref:Transporter substrate-binding domain-containing protein n=1 Tax=Vreelandella zhaodongensis TaxID=1176240 RepID=A0ABX2SSV4_VREZH|nr:transporter substrate-binding domain-containing protein [Halomonas zhaodongensis]NYS44499.1 transporter substrate-binding domain-containing protein [Halomonas zhaodongensis]